ncbi:hypothetical protein BDV95DRAFT_530978 [Massariosphaeria phaeospora]|uniref:BTB domain-containing protein n=1 Tax=Massariosphaeria phaeospora TaxID=100035 RepID=A0A7C8HZ08_9PLEO|nr:hypothetical protein BDV95DRAFT_530978 [Massariosphaeria phaeospora]
MPRVNYQIDAHADTAIILKNPNASFAPWSLAEVGGDTTAFAHESTVNEPTSGDVDQGASIEVAIIADDASESGPTDTEGDETWYYVSRRHLVSASPTLERMFSGTNWKEGIRDENDGLYHVPAEDWDSEALLCVLQVLHLRNGQVPRTVSLEMLAKIAVLLDFYKCAEALESFTERWIERLRVTTPVPSYFCRDTLLWMCIAWVLRLPQEFVQTTTVAIRRDEQGLPTLGLPITICVDRVEESRRQAIGTIFSRLQDLLEEFRSPHYRCPQGDSFECGSILYGALFKEMELQGLFPIPTAPYYDVSISELCNKMQLIRSPAWWPSKSKKSKHCCDLTKRVMAIADSVTRFGNGPELKDFEFY